MVKMDKILAKMRNNPKDWTIDNLKTLAQRSGIDWRQPGTSHVTFSYPGIEPLTVPSHKPIKPIYVKRFLDLIDRVGEKNED
jgi:hypothetical protein